MSWVDALACESIAVPAFCSTWLLAKLADSAAKSESIMRDLAAEVFSDTFMRLSTVWNIRLDTAPILERKSAIISKALSTTVKACLALVLSVTNTSSMLLAADTLAVCTAVVAEAMAVPAATPVNTNLPLVTALLA